MYPSSKNVLYNFITAGIGANFQTQRHRTTDIQTNIRTERCESGNNFLDMQ